MPIQFPAKGYNPDPITRAQKFSHNALVNDANQLQNKANQQGFDQANAQKGKETLYNMATQTLKFIEQAGGDAVGVWSKVHPDWQRNLSDLNMPVDKLPPAGASQESILEGLNNIANNAELGGGNQQPDPTLVKDAAGYQRHAGGDQFGERAFPDVVATPGANGSIPAKIQQAEWWKAADATDRESYMTANYAGSVQDINGIPTWVFPGGATLPLSTAASEDAAAAQRKLVEGEGSRGRLQNDEGTFEEVPGSEADIKKKEADRKRAGGAFMKSIQAQTVVEDVGRLNVMLDADEVPFGRAAMIQEKLTPALQSDAYRNATSLIDSVKGNVGIDSLLRIKASGAGLGQVPQSQLDMLSQLLGDLHLKQSREQFMYTWNRMGVVYEIVMDQAEDDLYSLDVESPNVSAESIALKQAREAILDGSGTRETVIKKLTENGYDASKL